MCGENIFSMNQRLKMAYQYFLDTLTTNMDMFIFTSNVSMYTFLLWLRDLCSIN